jgi:hypothetical protein
MNSISNFVKKASSYSFEVWILPYSNIRIQDKKRLRLFITGIIQGNGILCSSGAGIFLQIFQTLTHGYTRVIAIWSFYGIKNR